MRFLIVNNHETCAVIHLDKVKTFYKCYTDGHGNDGFYLHVHYQDGTSLFTVNQFTQNKLNEIFDAITKCLHDYYVKILNKD